MPHDDLLPAYDTLLREGLFHMTRFTHLHTHSHYSLLDGLSKVDDLVKQAKEHGMDSLAITDHGVLYGAIEFYKKAKHAGIKPIIGCEMYMTEGSRHHKTPGVDDKRFHLILLAKNNEGYKNLIRLVTLAHLEGFYYKPRIDKEALREHAQGLVGTSACLGGEISQALMANNWDKAKHIAREYEDILGKGNFFIELQQHDKIEEQNKVTPMLVQLARELNIPMIATQDSHYICEEDAHAHDILLAVQTGNTIYDKERFSMKHDDFSFLSAEKMKEKFMPLGEDVAKEALENTRRIADMCDVEIDLKTTHLPPYQLPEDYSEAHEYLKKVAYDGAHKRFGDVLSKEITERLDYELGVIKETGFSSYFLIVQDFVSWAKAQGIFVGPGRGSAAGSLVTYTLHITNIDPLKYKLIFERFLNPERISMPDIDIDFSDSRRDEVMHYVSEKYGKDHVAQVITFGTMAARAAIRDAGRGLGYSYEFCDRIAKTIPFSPNQGQKTGYLAECIRSVPEVNNVYKGDAQAKTLIDAAMKLEGVVRHASTHACAVVITPKPLTEYLPLQQGTKPGDIITQYEMHAVEDLGLLKMDFLGLSNLTIIEDTLKLVKKHHGIEIDIDSIPLKDEATFKLLQEARTTGVFQLESAGMKRYLKGLKPTEFEDVLSMVALYRPGPMDSLPDFIEAKHGRKKVTYLHPSLEPILRDSYGIIVTQDQVLQVARTFAGFTYSEADILRKAVGKKIKSLLDQQKDKFCKGAVSQGHVPQLAEKVWNFIEPFARYGFNRAHAACYGMIAYQTAYLKANWPTEFMTAFMNSETGDVERIAFLIKEARDMNIEVMPPDINKSFERFSITEGTGSQRPTVQFGLTAVKNVGAGVVQLIIQERTENGPFVDTDDLVTRLAHRAAASETPGAAINKKSLESLIKCGACDILGERNQLLTNLDPLLSYARDKQKNATMGQGSLFGDATELPPMKLTPADSSDEWEKLRWEKELLGLYVSDHPLNRYQARLALENVTAIKDIKPIEGAPTKIAGLVTSTRRITTKTGKPMLFSQIEDLTSRIEVVVFPNVLEKSPNAWNENTLVILKGKVNNRDGETKILCDAAKAIDMLSSTAPEPAAV